MFVEIIFSNSFDGSKLALHLIYMKNETMNSSLNFGCSENEDPLKLRPKA